MATRNGSAQWNGDLKNGTGELTVGEGAWTGNYSFASRALAGVLAEHDHEPASVSTTARVHLRNVDGAPTIQEIELQTEGNVPGIDEHHFRKAAEEAKASCPVSRALGGVEKISLTASLAS